MPVQIVTGQQLKQSSTFYTVVNMCRPRTDRRRGNSVAGGNHKGSGTIFSDTHHNNSNIEAHQQVYEEMDPIKQQAEPILLNTTAQYEQENGDGDPDRDPSDNSSEDGGE